MKTNLINKREANISNVLFCNDSNELLQMVNYNFQKNSVLLEIIEFGEVGFERKSDWSRLNNKLEKYNHDQLLNRFFKNSNKLEIEEGFYIELIDKIYGTIKVVFENKKSVIVGETKENYITFDATELQGTLSWEWFSTSNNPLEICNGIEVLLTNIEIIK